MQNDEQPEKLRIEDTTIHGEGDIEILMIIRHEGGQKSIPLRIWTATENGIGVVIEKESAPFVKSFWEAASRSLEASLEGVEDDCDCPKCTARRALESAVEIAKEAGGTLEIPEDMELPPQLAALFAGMKGKKHFH